MTLEASGQVGLDIAALTRSDFNRFFRSKYWELLRAAFDRRQRRPDYRDPAVIEAIAAGYRDLPRGGGSKVPRHIFMLWQQGWDSAPPLVHACADSWRRHNPGWELHLLDDSSLPATSPSWTSYAKIALSRPARSDLARLALLSDHGGVWADATLFCTLPVDKWLPSAASAGLFAFSRPRPYRYMDVWFMASEFGDPTLASLSALVARYWQLFDRPHHYYWLPYLFEMLAERSREVLAVAEAMPKLSALGPLAVGGNPFDRQAPKAMFDLIAANTVPVHKLSHKWPARPDLAGTPLAALTGLAAI